MHYSFYKEAEYVDKIAKDAKEAIDFSASPKEMEKKEKNKIIDFSKYSSEQREKIRLAYDLLAKICEITPNNALQYNEQMGYYEKYISNDPSRNDKLMIGDNYLRISDSFHKYKIGFFHDKGQLVFTIENRNGYYEFLDGKLSFYDKDAVTYLENMREVRKNSSLMFEDIGIEPDEVVSITNTNGDLPSIVQAIELFAALKKAIDHNMYFENTPNLVTTTEYAFDLEEEAKKYR